MTAASAVSDANSERDPSPVEPIATISARHLARNTAAVLRAVADEGHSYAVTHFGRVIGFIVPLEGRAAVRRGRKLVYEAPQPEPLLELNDVEASVLVTLYRTGKTVPDRLVGKNDVLSVMAAVGRLEFTKPPLLARDWGSYDLTPAGLRHAEALGA